MHPAVKLDGRKPKIIQVDAAAFTEFRHGYAGPYAGQGRTLQQTYLYHSEHWRSAPSYVALTRHKERTDLFVARNTAADIKQLGKQMARIDERRAASMFELDQPLVPVAALSAAALSAKFAPAIARREHMRRPPVAEPEEQIIARAVGDNYGRCMQTRSRYRRRPRCSRARSTPKSLAQGQVGPRQPCTGRFPSLVIDHMTAGFACRRIRLSLDVATQPTQSLHQPAPDQPRRRFPRIRLGSADERIGKAPRAPWIQFGPAAPAPSAASTLAKHSSQPDPTADINMPPPAIAPPPRQQDSPPKGQTSRPASRSPNPIRQQFGEAKRKVTRRGDSRRAPAAQAKTAGRRTAAFYRRQSDDQTPGPGGGVDPSIFWGTRNSCRAIPGHAPRSAVRRLVRGESRFRKRDFRQLQSEQCEWSGRLSLSQPLNASL